MCVTAAINGWSPGPNNVLLLVLSGKYGLKKVFRFMTGIWTGALLLTVFTGFLISALTGIAPKLQPYTKYLGAAYLIYLAYKTLLRQPSSESDVSTIPTFRDGMLMQLLNSKLILVILTMYSSYVLPITTAPLIILIYAFYLTFFTATGNLIWACLGHIINPVYKKHYRLVNLVMAVLLVWCVLRILGIL